MSVVYLQEAAFFVNIEDDDDKVLYANGRLIDLDTPLAKMSSVNRDLAEASLSLYLYLYGPVLED